MKNKILSLTNLIIHVMAVFVCLMSAQTGKTQSQEIQFDLLQGKWWFRSLNTTFNFDMNSQTGPYNPYNLYFTIQQDTCTFISLVNKNSDPYQYDTTKYFITLEDDRLSFFPLINNKTSKKPSHFLRCKALQNQSLTFEDVEGEQLNESLFLRNASFSYTFSRNADLYKSGGNARRELKGIWYCDYAFFDHIKDEDTLTLSAIPFCRYDTLDLSSERIVYSTYKMVEFSDETIHDIDSVAFHDDSPVVMAEKLIDAFFIPTAYYIVPDKKLIEIEISDIYWEEHRMPFYTKRRYQFSYVQSPEKLLLIRR